jgi:hypothetical protein
MKNDLEAIYEILQPRIDRQILEGLFSATFNTEKDKFFAFTFMQLADINYDDYRYALLEFNGHSSINADEERQKVYITPTSWQMKSTDECVSEKIYTSYAIRFSGIFYENEWYIQKELCYFG